MKKIGKCFGRDVEFTGSCDAAIAGQGRLLDNLQRRGFEAPGMKMGGMQPMRGSMLMGPAVRGYMQDVEEKTAVVELNDDQKNKIKQVTGWAPSRVEVSITPTEKKQEIVLTQEQQKAINDALGIQMTSITVQREPVEAHIR